MSETEKQELELWTPRKLPFTCTDLMPTTISSGGDEELVGRDNIDASDIVLPKLKLLQSTSPPVQQGDGDAKAGLFWLSTTGTVIEPPLRALALQHHKTRFLIDNDRAVESCFSNDMLQGTTHGSCDSCSHKEWGQNNEPPLCSESHNFVLLLEGHGPCIIRFARSAFKLGRDFVGGFSVSGKNLWHHPVVLRVRQGTNPDKGNALYHIPVIQWDAADTLPLEMRQAARSMFDQFQAAFEAGRLVEHDRDSD